MLFNPNNTCVIIKNTGYNMYGEPVRFERIQERCAILNAGAAMKKTSVRADSSASRGNALELVADFWLILMPDTCAQMDDLIEVANTQVKIFKLIPRFGLDGTHDHTEAYCTMWNGIEE